MVHDLWNQWPKYLLVNSIKNSVKEETINNVVNRGKVSALSLSLSLQIFVFLNLGLTTAPCRLSVTDGEILTTLFRLSVMGFSLDTRSVFTQHVTLADTA